MKALLVATVAMTFVCFSLMSFADPEPVHVKLFEVDEDWITITWFEEEVPTVYVCYGFAVDAEYVTCRFSNSSPMAGVSWDYWDGNSWEDPDVEDDELDTLYYYWMEHKEDEEVEDLYYGDGDNICRASWPGIGYWTWILETNCL